MSRQRRLGSQRVPAWRRVSRISRAYPMWRPTTRNASMISLAQFFSFSCFFLSASYTVTHSPICAFANSARNCAFSPLSPSYRYRLGAQRYLRKFMAVFVSSARFIATVGFQVLSDAQFRIHLRKSHDPTFS